MRFFILVFVILSFKLLGQNTYVNTLKEMQKEALVSNYFQDKLDSNLTEIEAQKIYDQIGFKFLFELKYGIKPSYISYLNLSEKIDSTSINIAFSEIPNIKSFEEVKTEFLVNGNMDLAFLSGFNTDSLSQEYNFYRWLNRFDLNDFIIVNVASATLEAIKEKKKAFSMPVIVGQKQNQTPFFASNIESLTTYPYWFPTKSILEKELLPKIKKNPKFLKESNFEVIGVKGKVINADTIKWTQIEIKKFPYRLRQSTGCDNSLGLIKFNLKNPFTVYLHDTNHSLKSLSLFKNKNRFYSHGCIRVSDPIKLANFVSKSKKFDNSFFNACMLNQTPETVLLKQKIPIFIVYLLHEKKRDVFVNYPNVYKLTFPKNTQ